MTKPCVVCGAPAHYRNPDRCLSHRKFRVEINCPSCGAHYWRRDDRPTPPRFCKRCGASLLTTQQAATKSREDAISFLSRGRTRRELEERYKDQTAAILSADYPGYYLFAQRNERNEQLYILLPEYHDDVTVRPREWRYYRGSDEDGVDQPYLLVQLPESAFEDSDRIIVVPLADVHFGHLSCKREKLLSYIRWIEEHPNIYWIGLGDLAENALDDDRGMTYDQDDPPVSQLDQLRRLLAPIAHKCLVMLPGNHEWRTYKRAGIDPTRYLAERLDIPYFEGPVILSILANGYKWLFWVEHGRTNSQTKGGKLNAAGRARKFTGLINFFVSGHTHDPLINSETCIHEDPVNCRLIYPQQWTVVASSFLRWEGTYAWRAGLAPPGKGGVTCELFANGEYRAALK